MTVEVGVLVPRCCQISQTVNMRYFLRESSSPLAGKDLTNKMCSNDDEGRVYHIENFMTPGLGVRVLRCCHISHLMKMR